MCRSRIAVILCTGVAATACAAAGSAPAVSAATPKLSGLDSQYLMNSIEGDRFEVQGGSHALTVSSNPAVRTLAARIAKDHTQSLKESIALAKRFGVQVPASPSPSQQWELRITASLSGAAFNRWWSDLEVQDHTQDITEATDEVKDGANAVVRASARKEIPTLRIHLKLAQAALKAS
jgi:putative membrane protein